MKRSGAFVASMAAASATAISSSSSLSSNNISKEESGINSNSGGHADSKNSASTERFTPRFDGLRFIETLVTAHR